MRGLRHRVGFGNDAEARWTPGAPVSAALPPEGPLPAHLPIRTCELQHRHCNVTQPRASGALTPPASAAALETPVPVAFLRVSCSDGENSGFVTVGKSQGH